MKRRLLALCHPLFVSVGVVVTCLVLMTRWALADAGDALSLDPALLDLAFKGIAEGNWFLVAGPILAVVVRFARPVLAWRWPTLGTSDRWGVAITAALAGAGALAHAWLADEPVADTMTLLGAVKVFVMAVATYVVTKKLAPKKPPAPSSAGLVSLMIGVALLLGCKTGKHALEHAGAAAANAVDCTSPAAADYVSTTTPALAAVIRAATSPDGHVDWTPIGDASKGLKTALKQCALAAAVKEALAIGAELVGAPQSAPAELDRESLRAGWEAQRAAWGGATYKLETGAL